MKNKIKYILIFIIGVSIIFPKTVYAQMNVNQNNILLINAVNNNNNITNTFITLDAEVNDTSIGEICSMPQYRKTTRFFGTIVTFAKYIVPIIIIAFGIMDLYKAVTGVKDDEIKKAFKAIMVRIAAGVLIFLLPGLVQFFFNMLNEWSNYKVDVCCCTECLLNSSCDTNSCNSGSCKIEGMNN